MALRAQNTMSELLSGMLSDIGQAKAMPDADLAFLTELETVILQRLRAPVDAMAGQSPEMGGMPGVGGGPVPGMGPGSAPPGPPPPPGPMMGQPGGAPIGLPARPEAPNPDELRRLLAPGPGA